MPRSKVDSSVLSANLGAVLDEHLEDMKSRIAERALEIANGRGNQVDEEISPADLSSLNQAIEELVNGRFSPNAIEQKFRLFDWFPPFTIVCAILCLSFATLGLFPLLTSSENVAKMGSVTSSFLDIAKIFAGAIVGSTSSVALKATRSRREK